MAGQEHRCRRIVLFPLPLQGHISPTLQLAALLHARGLAVTVLHTGFNAPDTTRHPELTFVPIHESSFPDEAMSPDIVTQLLALNAACEAPFREALASLLRGGQDVACAVVDGQCYSALRAAHRLGVPALVLRTDSAATFSSMLAYPRLRDAGFVPVKGK
jgi:UDP-glucosyltransferase BX8/BX9